MSEEKKPNSKPSKPSVSDDNLSVDNRAPAEETNSQSTKTANQLISKLNKIKLLEEQLAVQAIESERTQKLQQALFKISNLASGAEDLELFYQRIHRTVSEISYAENFYIALHEPEEQRIRMVYFVDVVEKLTAKEIAPIPITKENRSLTVYLMEQGEAFLGDQQQMLDLIASENLKTQGSLTNSWLGIPLIADGKTIGVMTLQSYRKDFELTESDKELMVFVSQHVATAIERKSNKFQLQRLVEQKTLELVEINKKLNAQVIETGRSQSIQAALYQITDLVSTANNLDYFYSSLHKIISELIYAKNLYICLYSEDKSNIDFVYYVDTEDYLDKESIKQIPTEDIKKTSTGHVLLTGESILKTPENWEELSKNGIKRVGKRSLYWLGVPLKIEDHVIGAIVVQSYSLDYTFGDDEKELLEFVSQHIAIALERRQSQTALERRVDERTSEIAETNNKLTQEIAERKRSEETQALLYRISNLGMQNIPRQKLFEQVHQFISEIIPSEYFYIGLINHENNEMDWIYFVDSDDDYDYSVADSMSEEERKKTFAHFVTNSGKPLLVDKAGVLAMHERGEVTLIGPTPENYLGIPLNTAHTTIGVMALQSYNPDFSYTKSDLELLTFVSQSIVSTIERRAQNIRLEATVKQRTEEISLTNWQLQSEITQRRSSEKLQTALYQISETSQRCATESELYPQLHEIISQLMFAENFYIATINEERKEFSFDYNHDDKDESLPKTIPFGKTLTKYVYDIRETVHFNQENIQDLAEQGTIELVGEASYEWIGVPLIANGEILGIMVLQSYDRSIVYGEKDIEILNFVSTHIADALERKKAEQELRDAYQAIEEKSKKALAASEAKSSFLATVSHEIRTPMNGILGMLTLISDTSLTNRQMDYISKIEVSAQSLLGIINDILDFSKIEQGKMHLDKVEFDLLELMENLTDIFSANLVEKNLNFNILVDNNVSRVRLGDPLRLSQILINLIGNAIKFTETGFVNLVVKQVNDQRIYFSVEDSGIGIAKEKRERIFASFTQADDTTTRKFGGSGLGLSICQQLVNMMNGEITVSGDSGKGSQFSFEILLEAVPNPASPKLNGQTILLVSDDNYQIKSWEQFSIRKDFKLEVKSFKQLKERLSVNKTLKTEYSQIFINAGINANPEIDELNLAQLHNNKKSFLYFLHQPNSFEPDLPQPDGYVEVITKPVKKSTIFKILSTACKSTKEKASTKITESKIRPLIKNKKVLIAEDNLINQQVARQILKIAGADVTIVGNGQLAVDACQKDQFDIVLMDMQMPILDGYNASKKIRESFSKDALPIVAMTANVMQGDREKCLEFGMNDYIGKPINRKALFEVIEPFLTP